MILTYADGSKTEAVILSRTENKIRAAIPGVDDPMEFTDIHGTWVSEDCEPVRIEFAWQSKTRAELLSEADCLCSHELAARLIQMLWRGSDEDEPKAETPLPVRDALAFRGTV